MNSFKNQFFGVSCGTPHELGTPSKCPLRCRLGAATVSHRLGIARRFELEDVAAVCVVLRLSTPCCFMTPMEAYGCLVQNCIMSGEPLSACAAVVFAAPLRRFATVYIVMAGMAND